MKAKDKKKHTIYVRTTISICFELLVQVRHRFLIPDQGLNLIGGDNPHSSSNCHVSMIGRPFQSCISIIKKTIRSTSTYSS